MSEVEIGSKKIFVYRCLIAISLSISIQYFLLSLFLLFVNIEIFHPISWILNTIGIIFSTYTWLCITPLMSAVILYGIFLGNSHLTIRKYYPTRFSCIKGTAAKRLLSMSLHIMIGFLTAWLYSRFLDEIYSNMFLECFDDYCLNSRYVYLTSAGIYIGIYFFIKECLNKESDLKFPIIQECKFAKIRSNLYSTIYSSLLKSILPTIIFTFIFWIVGDIFTKRLAQIFGTENDQTLNSFYSFITNPRLILYAWILSSQILSNMYLMDLFFTILLTQQIKFPIEKNPVYNVQGDITLVEALSLFKLPITQNLASLDLFNLANSSNSTRRKQIFSLSIPGGHAYNWNQLSGQCLSIINSFTDELSLSIKKFSNIPAINPCYVNVKPSATEVAEKILLQQYNQSCRIRNLMNQTFVPPQPPVKDSCNRIQNFYEQLNKSFEDSLRIAFRSIPGLFYLFGEQDESKVIFLLKHSEKIIWLTQALAALCAASLNEDQYGVVQRELPNIIKSLLKLKIELDKVIGVNLNGKRIDKNCVALRGAVKRSLYRICTVFADYMKDLIDDPDELRILHQFSSYQEA